jgi:hypothetical protein
MRAEIVLLAADGMTNLETLRHAVQRALSAARPGLPASAPPR